MFISRACEIENHSVIFEASKMTTTPPPSSSAFNSMTVPKAPKKRKTMIDLTRLDKISKLEIPPTPPPAPKKNLSLAPRRHLSQIILDWDLTEVDLEARHLTESGFVREKYLRFCPMDVWEECDRLFLEHLSHLYNPASQPRTFEEGAYLALMETAIRHRLQELSPVPPPNSPFL